MKNQIKILFSGLTLTVISLSGVQAQNPKEIKLEGVPKTIGWNLHLEAKQELRMKDFEYPISFEDPSIWSQPKELEIEPVGLKPESFGITDRDFNYQRFISLVLQGGDYELFPTWGVPQLFLVTGYDGKAVWIPTEKTRSGGEIARIGSNKSRAYTSSQKQTRFFPDDPRRSRVNDIWLFVKVKK